MSDSYKNLQVRSEGAKAYSENKKINEIRENLIDKYRCGEISEEGLSIELSKIPNSLAVTNPYACGSKNNVLWHEGYLDAMYGH